MRAWVGTPQTIDALGQQMMIGNRNDGYSVMMPVAGMSTERLRRELDSYLDNGCICDSSKPLTCCGVHREVCVV